MARNRIRSVGLSVLVVAASWHAAARAQENLILTSLPVTYSLASSLAEGTSIAVENLPERGRRLGGLGNYFQSRGERLADTFMVADAVVTIGKLWPEDPLFTAARQFNIRIVDIDATKPWSTSLEGVSVAFEPLSDAPWEERANRSERRPSVFFWLSLANGARAADIVARDLMRLFPGDEAAIAENLDRLRAQLLELKREYEVKLAALPDVTVYALAPEFVYLAADMGLFVDGYFLKQDVDWSAADLAALESYLAGNEIGVVMHKWQPSEEIATAIAGAGAELVVLETLDAGIVEDGRLTPSSYTELMRQNLEAIHAALSAANE